MITRLGKSCLALAALLYLLPTLVTASSSGSDTRWVEYTNADGEEIFLADDRQPALYTQNYGDCLGSSLINVTRFDAAYYNDNMTVLIHLAGHTTVANDYVMMYIGVYAYGESRFDLIANPCNTALGGLCPLNSTIAISANGIIPTSPDDVANVPSIAYSIPDFEGEAILRIFSNTTQQEIACYSGAVTNGNSFSQPATVSSVLGFFTLVAMIASFATAIYGEAVPTMRLHYAHSMSVGVVFAVFQHIFFSGTLSVNWPSVLVAWWSNFAWAGGMIYISGMQQSINTFIGNDVGNTTQVGAAQAGSYQANLGGGFDISQIYKRAFSSGMKRAANHPLSRDIAGEIYGRSSNAKLKRGVIQRAAEHTFSSRDVLANATTGYKWYGNAVGAGLPLPGNYSGFAGTLAEEGIRVSNAFLTGFLWFLILLAFVILAVVLFKLIIEALARIKFVSSVRNDSLPFFRKHWLGYTFLAALRTCYIAFFMIMLLTIFQFTFESPAQVKAIAAVVFGIFFLSMFGVAIYAIWYEQAVTANKMKQRVERKMLLGKIPWFGVKSVGQTDEEGNVTAEDEKIKSTSFWQRKDITHDNYGNRDPNSINIHDDEDYIVKFGWLASRFRRSRWWFFSVWLCYEFVRAAFYGGASGYALAQVFGLLVVEILAFAFVIWAKPFEGQRLNIIVVYCLGFSKVATVALSATFDTRFNIGRITTTVLGVVIIVIQGILTIITLIAIAVGAVSSYMSISRNTSEREFRPRSWRTIRERYFDHLDRAVNDLPPEPKPEPIIEIPQEPKFGFEVQGIKRQRKIEDEDAIFASEMRAAAASAPYIAMEPTRTTSSINPVGPETPKQRSRAGSTHSVNLPFGARPNRPSWNSRDFSASQVPTRGGTPTTYVPIDMNAQVADDQPAAPAPAASRHARKPSRTASINEVLSTSKSSELIAQTSHAPQQVSAEQLRVGGETSTYDTIGDVPAPITRPRTTSLRTSRPNSRLGGWPLSEEGENDVIAESSAAGARSGAAKTSLAPAAEKDE